MEKEITTVLERRVIPEVTAATKNAIKRKTAFNLPDRPSDMGMKPSEIKKAFWSPVIDDEHSVLSELERVIRDTNIAFDELVYPPFEDGEGKNSGVQDAESPNRAIGDGTLALGNGTVAGSRAYRIKDYDSTVRRYYLDVAANDDAWLEGIEVGVDCYSIYWRFRRTKFGKITFAGNVDGKACIAVDNFFEPGVSEAEKQEYLAEAYIYIVGKPHLGTVTIGATAVSSGIGTVAAESETDAGGKNTISDGRYAFSRGYGNVTGYCGASFGQDNENLGLKGFAGGGQGNYIGPNVERAAVFNFLNTILANDGAAFGQNNKVDVGGVRGFVAGLGNVVNRPNQAKFGKYSPTDTNALWSVGNGTSDTERKMAFGVWEDGHAEVQSVGDSPKSVVNEKFVRDNYVPRIRSYGKNMIAVEMSESRGTAGYELSQNAVGNGIPERDDNGQLNVPLVPTMDYHAASKKYADELRDTAESNAKTYADGTGDYSANGFVPIQPDKTSLKKGSGYSAYVLFGDSNNLDANGNPVQTPQLKAISRRGIGSALAQYDSNGRLSDNGAASFAAYGNAELPNKKAIADYLNDGTAGYLKTVKDAVDAGINAFATEVTDNGAVDKFAELVSYVSEHGGEAKNMATAITNLQNNKADNTHNHDGVYSPLGHNHDDIYSKPGHTHNYAEKNGTYSAMTVGKATTADSATKATQDGNGNVISDTYATKEELGNVAIEDIPVATAEANGLMSAADKALFQKFEQAYNADDDVFDITVKCAEEASGFPHFHGMSSDGINYYCTSDMEYVFYEGFCINFTPSRDNTSTNVNLIINGITYKVYLGGACEGVIQVNPTSGCFIAPYSYILKYNAQSKAWNTLAPWIVKKAETAKYAEFDGEGNEITETYAKKTENIFISIGKFLGFMENTSVNGKITTIGKVKGIAFLNINGRLGSQDVQMVVPINFSAYQAAQMHTDTYYYQFIDLNPKYTPLMIGLSYNETTGWNIQLCRISQDYVMPSSYSLGFHLM